MLDDHHGDVVEFDRVGQRHERPVCGANDVRLVVVHPVADIFHAGRGEQFRRLVGLRQTGAKPAQRAFAGKALENIHRAVDHVLLILMLVDRHLVVGMTHELPRLAARLFGDPLIVLTDARVYGERRLDAARAEQVEESPHADPHAVFVPAPVRHVRQQRRAGRGRQYLARHRPADVPDLEIDDRPQDEARTPRQPQRRPIHDGGVVGALAR
jgi:hypothetical protein